MESENPQPAAALRRQDSDREGPPGSPVPAPTPPVLSAFFRSVVEWFVPAPLRSAEQEVLARFERADLDLNSFGYDPWGFHPGQASRTLAPLLLLYRHYFRVRTRNIENLPDARVLLIANHAGQIALDAAMIAIATLFEADPPRMLRGMGEYWLSRLPYFNVAMIRAGSLVGTPKNCADLLGHEEAVIAFPEGVRGMNKAFWKRYELQEFGFGFMRLALETRTPILPVAVVGSEEQAPSLGSIDPLARALGMPAFPLVLTPVPLPVRYHIEFGEPLWFSGNPHDEDRLIEEKVDVVRDRLRTMLDHGVATREGIFT